MIKCNDCGKMFDECEMVVIKDDPSPMGVGLPSGYYESYACPHCGSDDLEETRPCASCGGVVDDDGVLCDDCKSELAGLLDGIRDEFGMTKDDFEEAIAEIFGW